MSTDQMTRGLEMIASAAEKVDLHLGSRAVDLFRGIVRLSFEKEVQSGSRSQFRAPTFEFSREFVEDLPAQKEYQTAVADFLQSLKGLLQQELAENPRLERSSPALRLEPLRLVADTIWPRRSDPDPMLAIERLG